MQGIPLTKSQLKSRMMVGMRVIVVTFCSHKSIVSLQMHHKNMHLKQCKSKRRTKHVTKVEYRVTREWHRSVVFL